MKVMTSWRRKQLVVLLCLLRVTAAAVPVGKLHPTFTFFSALSSSSSLSLFFCIFSLIRSFFSAPVSLLFFYAWLELMQFLYCIDNRRTVNAVYQGRILGACLGWPWPPNMVALLAP